MKRARRNVAAERVALEDRINILRGILSAVEVLARQDRRIAERVLLAALAAEVDA